jgi:hypothetical protein
VGTIEDDDGPEAQFDSSDYTVDEDAATATITVTLSETSVQTVTVDYATSDDTATAPQDYTAASGTLTFAPGETSKTFTVSIIDDAIDENGEDINLTLSNPDNATLGTPNSAELTIVDDETLPTVQFTVPDVTLDESIGTATIPVTLSNPSAFTVTVDYATSNGTATAPQDYTAISGTLIFAPGEITRTIALNITDDPTDEADETIDITLSNPDKAILGVPETTTVKISDNDGMPTVQFATANKTVDEGNGTATLPVTLNQPSAFTVTVDYTVTGGDATAGDDYTLPGTSLTFAPGEITRTITLNLTDDNLHEADETLELTLDNPGNADLGMTDTVTLTIQDNDTAPEISIDDVTVTEGSMATFTVTFSNPSNAAVTVDYATADGTATAGDDYTAIVTATLTFDPGETSKVIPVQVRDDALDEDDETFFVELSTPTNATITDNRGVGTIEDDDTTSISIDDVSMTEGDAGETVDAAFTVTLSNPSSNAVRVDYATANATATEGNDYNLSSGTLTFAPGETSKSITVQVNGDTLDEVDETFFVNLSNPDNATLADNQGEGTIEDDDNPPTVSFTTPDRNAVEDAASVSFTVELSAPSGKSITVDYTATGEATAGADYTLPGTTLTFAPGEQTKTIPVTISDDDIDEPDERLTLTLSSADVSVGTPDVTLTIQDNDAAPEISIDDVSVTEGDDGDTVDAIFTVTLANPSSAAVTVDYTTADATATVGDDYTAMPPTTLMFAPGITSQTITVEVLDDTLDEVNETFDVELSNAANATIPGGTIKGTGTINDDDAAPELSIDDVTVTESNSGTVDATFTVSLAAASGKSVTVDYATLDDTALAGSDYTTISGTLTFDPGDTSKQFTVQVVGDTTDEADETFFVNLSNATNATIADNQGVGTITDDDTPPAISIDDVTVTEGNGSSVDATFTVSLAAASGKPINVDYATADDSATAGDDYTALSGTLTFAPGTTSRTVTVEVLGDTLDEAQETFFVDLTSTDAPVADGQGEGTITDNDTQPNISINDVTVTEGDSGTVDATFTISLSASSGRAVMVKYATSDGTAQGGSDYTATTTSTLTFTPGQTDRTFTVQVDGDTNDEVNETFFLNLSNPVNATITDSQGEGTIIDDDGPTVSFASASYSVDEDSGQAIIIVTLDATSPQTVMVEYATSDATPPSATAGSDYTATSGTLSFKPGESSRVFTVDITDDTDAENPETLQLTLSNPDNAGLGVQTSATLEIIDDEPYVEFRKSNYNVDEDGGPAVIEVRLSEPVNAPVTVAYAIGDGPSPGARAGDDYTHTSGTLTFNPGNTSATFPISILNDTLGEDDELVNLTISNPSANVWLGSDNTATLTIKDDEPRVQFDISTYPNSADEDAGTATVEVILTRPAGAPVQVDYTVTDGSSRAAEAGKDYLATSGTLTFNPSETSKTFTFTILEDNLGEWDERIQLILSNPTPNVWLGSPHDTAFKIDDNEPRIKFTNNTFDVNEDAGSATITVELNRTFTETVTVDYATSDNGADAGSDYTATSGTLTFDPGDTSKTFTVDIRDDNEGENNERVKLTLSNASANALIGDSTSNLRIRDDEPHVEFAQDAFTVDENAGTATIEVIRTGRDDLVVTVDYATSDDTAKAGSDYTSSSGTLTFGAGESSKTFTIPINNDSRDEYREELYLTLSNLSSNAWLDDGTAELKIDDDDPAAEISFSRSNYSADEGLGQQTVTVTLNEPTDRTVEVNYATADDSAVAGADYLATSGKLIFNAGETSKSFTVTIINDANSEGNETITLTLSSAKDAALGTPSTATITIVDND